MVGVGGKEQITCVDSPSPIGKGEQIQMNDDTRQELQALEELAAPSRFKTGLREDDQEPVIHGHGGVVEWHSLDGKTLAAFTTKPSIMKTLLGLPWAKQHQRGDKELRVVFPVERLLDMEPVLRLKKKRDAPRHLEQFHFIPGVQARKSA